MPAHIITIKDENDDSLYPVTKTNAVLDENNVDVGTRLNNLTNYSTSEIAIGKWIDGSTLYRKVFNYTTADTNHQWWNVENLDYLNIKAVIKIYGMISDGYHANVLPAAEGQYYRNLRYSEETKWLEHINNGFNNASGYIAIEYIKN